MNILNKTGYNCKGSKLLAVLVINCHNISETLPLQIDEQEGTTLEMNKFLAQLRMLHNTYPAHTPRVAPFPADSNSFLS